MVARGRTAPAALLVLAFAVPAGAQTGVWEKRADATSTMGGLNDTAMAYASGSFPGVLLWGGQNVGALQPFEAIWQWSGAAWQPLCGTAPCSSTVPAERRAHAMAYDSKRDRLVVFGGVAFGSGAALGDTWEFDGTAWEQVCTDAACAAGAPGPRLEHAMVYDVAHGVVLMYGGLADPASNTCLDELWSWDGSAWAKLQPATAPGGRFGMAFTYDAVRQRAVLFGGGCYQLLWNHGQTWEWDGDDWSPKPVAGPAGRLYASMTFDTHRSRTMMFGGTDESKGFDDVWQWDGASWSEIPVGASRPEPRCYQRAAFDAARGRLVVHGGNLGDPGGKMLADTWELHVVGDACQTAGECDTPFCAGGVCCDSACSGPCETCSGSSPGTCETEKDVETAACSGTHRCSPLGVCAAVAGQSCSTGAGCLSQNCVGGVCCNEAECQGFVCGADGSCLTSCTSSASCVAGWSCDSTGKCVGTGATCDGDHTLRGPDGTTRDCAPYRCALEGQCRTACESAGDCVDDFMCSSDGRCLPRSAWARALPLGACDVAGRTGDPRGVAVLSVLVLLAMHSRRARTSAPGARR